MGQNSLPMLYTQLLSCLELLSPFPKTGLHLWQDLFLLGPAFLVGLIGLCQAFTADAVLVVDPCWPRHPLAPARTAVVGRVGAGCRLGLSLDIRRASYTFCPWSWTSKGNLWKQLIRAKNELTYRPKSESPRKVPDKAPLKNHPP